MNRYWTLVRQAARRLARTWYVRAARGRYPLPGPGQALTRTIYVSLDPYQWGYKKRGVEPPGAPCHARTVAQVIESRMDGYAPGDLVFNTNGWAEYGLMGEGVQRPSYMIPRKLDPARGRISQAVGVLGMLGLTAYAGMVLQCDPKPGETRGWFRRPQAASARSPASWPGCAAPGWSASRASPRSAGS